MEARALLACAAVLAALFVIGAHPVAAAGPRPLVAGSTCRPKAANYGPCCCAAADARPVTVVRTATVTVKSPRLYARDHEADDDSALAYEVSEGPRLWARHLCPRCPAGRSAMSVAQAIARGIAASNAQLCCPARKTVTRTRTRTVARIPLATIAGRIWNDLDSNGMFSSPPDTPLGNARIQLLVGTASKARAPSSRLLGTVTTDAQGRFTMNVPPQPRGAPVTAVDPATGAILAQAVCRCSIGVDGIARRYGYFCASCSLAACAVARNDGVGSTRNDRSGSTNRAAIFHSVKDHGNSVNDHGNTVTDDGNDCHPKHQQCDSIDGQGCLLFEQRFDDANLPTSDMLLDQACIVSAATRGSCNVSFPAPQNPSKPLEPTVPFTGLRLTTNAKYAVGSVLLRRATSAADGFEVTFDQWQIGGTGADGIALFLSDGQFSLTSAGPSGGSLGYAALGVINRLGQLTTYPGVANGYLGVGIDVWGNFALDAETTTRFKGMNCTYGAQLPPTMRTGGVITVRGPGNSDKGYCWLATSNRIMGLKDYNNDNVDAGRRTVRVTLTPADEGPQLLTVELDLNDGNGFKNVTSLPAPTPIPKTFNIGLSSSTVSSSTTDPFFSEMLMHPFPPQISS
ncbi:hypothetical protein DFJ74DRAFT_739389 [Hyaloraphidium curvatum]|nr:hypothetical protein DFJ74DRAFT_739389 [Hyaloraphidium curvatum]